MSNDRVQVPLLVDRVDTEAIRAIKTTHGMGAAEFTRRAVFAALEEYRATGNLPRPVVRG